VEDRYGFLRTFLQSGYFGGGREGSMSCSYWAKGGSMMPIVTSEETAWTAS
jgi:hypothetical protein